LKSENVAYIPSVDHLRAFAATLVIFQHSVIWIGNMDEGLREPLYTTAGTPLGALAVEGHTGVALFMVLSGFIFTRICYGQAIIYPRFVLNRILRIYPLMFALFVVGCLVFPERADLKGLLGLIFIPASIGKAFGIWFVPEINPFTSLFWTIVPEFQFYLVFPLLLGLLVSRGVTSLGILIALAVVARALLWLNGYGARDIAYLTFFGRIDQFLLGMIAAVVYQGTRDRRSLILLCPIALAAMSVLLYFYGLAGGLRVEAGWKVIWPSVEGFVWAAFVIGYLKLAEGLPERLSRALAAIGTISFSIYLLHSFVISLVRRFGHIPFGFGPVEDALLNAIVIVLPLTIAISSVTYRLIELPFLRMRVRYLVRSSEREAWQQNASNVPSSAPDQSPMASDSVGLQRVPIGHK
jgi:peptidoglycan/LPS O-acetylase OafA/YrhL